MQKVNLINSNKMALAAITGLSFLIDSAIGCFANTDYITLGIWGVFVVSLLFVDLKIFEKYIFYLFQYTLNVIAVFLIENYSFYLNELGRGTERFNALLPITFAHWLVISILIIKDPAIEQRFLNFKESAITSYDKTIASLITAVFSFSCIYMLFHAAPHPSYSLGVDRFVYERDYISGLWKQLHTFTIWLLPAVVVLWHKEKKNTFLIPAVLFCTYMILVGHKLGVFLQVLLLFLPAIVSRLNLQTMNLENAKRVFAIGATVTLALSLSVFRNLKATFGLANNNFSTYIYSRLAQQGQMWWAVYGKESGGKLHIGEMFYSMGAFFKLNKNVIENKDYGITKMMKLVTPQKIYENKIRNNSVYAFSTEASLYYYLKIAGMLLVLAILAIALIYVTNWYWKTVLQGDCFGSVVAGRFYLSMLYVFMQTSFITIFSRRMLALLLLFVIERWVRKQITAYHSGTGIQKKRRPFSNRCNEIFM